MFRNDLFITLGVVSDVGKNVTPRLQGCTPQCLGACFCTFEEPRFNHPKYWTQIIADSVPALNEWGKGIDRAYPSSTTCVVYIIPRKRVY